VGEGAGDRVTGWEAQYAEHGWCVVEDLFDEATCDRVVDLAAEGYRMDVGAAGAGPLDYRPMGSVTNRALADLATDPRWAPIVLALVGPDARLYWEQLVTKPPFSRTPVPWHQDDGYAPVDPPGYVTCWLALEDATLANGCMWVLPGSHRAGTAAEHVDTGGFFRVGYDGPEDGVAVELRKGSALVFSSLMQHRSGPNSTAGHRRAWIVQFCPAHARHGRSGRPFTDRLRVATGGVWDPHPAREARFVLDA
jgi:ectoine hydroxylase-related dioxygenase (phytanoyl-CoA dioxygenase family)